MTKWQKYKGQNEKKRLSGKVVNFVSEKVVDGKMVNRKIVNGKVESGKMAKWENGRVEK